MDAYCATSWDSRFYPCSELVSHIAFAFVQLCLRANGNPKLGNSVSCFTVEETDPLLPRATDPTHIYRVIVADGASWVWQAVRRVSGLSAGPRRFWSHVLFSLLMGRCFSVALFAL
jgi:hypothetical protein